ncbi:MAG: hypothetical protein ACOY46_19880 [Bacillota bacterium]
MQRLFFHNPYDKSSIQQMESFQGVPDVTIINPFTDQSPSNIKVPWLPYMVDKQVALITEGLFYCGTVILSFKCRDHLDNDITDNPGLKVTVNGNTQDVTALDGIFEVEIECPVAMTLVVLIRDENGQGYFPADFEIMVEEVPAP